MNSLHIRTRATVREAAVLVAVLLAGLLACRPTPDARTDIPVIETSDVDPAVAKIIDDARAAVVEAVDAKAAAEDVGEAYGRYGRVLVAAEYVDAAQRALLRARELDPTDATWSYYLAGTYENQGDTERARAEIQNVIELEPENVAAQIRWGRSALDAGELDVAEDAFRQARSIDEDCAAAWEGLGKVARERGEFETAAASLERALALSPQSSALYYPLALTYRELGRDDDARDALAKRGESQVPVDDPRIAEISDVFGRGRAMADAAALAMKRGDLGRAQQLAADALAWSDGNSRVAVLNGVVAAQLDQPARAREIFEAHDDELVEASWNVCVQLSLSAATLDQREQCLKGHLEKFPNDTAALPAWADVLRERNRITEALEAYERCEESEASALGRVLSLAALGREREVLERVEIAIETYPQHHSFRHIKARMLASAEQLALRDPQSALALIEQIASERRNVDVAETYAMALAGAGYFGEAAALQRQALEQARSAGQDARARVLAQQAADYEAGRVPQAPWPSREILLTPVAPLSYRIPKFEIGT